MKKRIIAMFLCIATLHCVFTSCAKQKTAMEYRGEKITANMYSYWMSRIKSGYVSSANDTDEYWDTEYSDGGTYEDKMREIVDYNVKVNLVCMKLFDDLGLKLSSEDKNNVKTAISDLVLSYGSKSELNTVLARYNVNVDILEDIYIAELKATRVFDALYADGGERQIDDVELDDYFKENYSRVDIIMIYDSFEYKKNEKGDLIYNSATGAYEKTELSADEAAKKKALAEDVFEKIKAGEDFGELKAQYNEYPDGGRYDKGYFISSKDSDAYDASMLLAVSKMQIGDVEKIESEGAVCIIKRLELTEKPYLEDKYLDMFDNLVDYCEEADFNEYMGTLVKDVTVYDEVLSGFSVRKAALLAG